MKNVTRRKIAVITADMDMEYYAKIQNGIMCEARLRHFDVYIFNANVSSDETEKHNIGQYNIYTLVNLSEFDGVIVFSNLIYGQKIFTTLEKRMEGINIPVVGIDAPIGNHYCVGVENYQPMKEVVEHFIVHHKFSRIAYISGQFDIMDSRVRLKAYCDALLKHGIEVDQSKIFLGSFTKQHGGAVAKELLASGEELPQAVVCGNDEIAMGFCSVLRENGIKVPGQVAVSGFDNIFAARHYVPRLTTVGRTLESIGKEAVRKIESHLNGENPAKHTMFPAEPIFADSCGCKYEEDEGITHIRKRYLDMVDHYEKYLAKSNTMIEDLNDSKTFAVFLERLKYSIEELVCDRFYFCLDKELVEELEILDGTNSIGKISNKSRIEGYAPVMSVPLAYEFGAFVKYDDFPSEWMLPWKKEAPCGNHTYIFAAVHFREVCQGYVIVENSEFAMSSALFRMWMINLCSCLENLWKQAKLKHVLERLDRLYVVDSLTDLYNRFGFARYTKENFANCAKQRKQLMILFADMDGLKKINDMYGHDKGDAAIKAVADALKEARMQDEVCARFGGDEYVVYAADYDEEKAKRFCVRFEEALARYNESAKHPFSVVASYDYELFVPGEEETIDKYIDKADEKMYKKKSEKYTRQKEEDKGI